MKLRDIFEEEYLMERAARRWWKESDIADKIKVLVADRIMKPEAEKIIRSASSWSQLSRENKKHVLNGLVNLNWVSEGTFSNLGLNGNGDYVFKNLLAQSNAQQLASPGFQKKKKKEVAKEAVVDDSDEE